MNNLPETLTRGRSDEGAEAISALVAYEDPPTRDRALRVCDRLMERFWKDLEFNFSWWRFDFFTDSTMVEAAASAAAHSHLLLVAAHARRELPSAVQRWVEAWLPRRQSRPGVLAAMIGTEHDELRGLTPIHVYLRETARRAHMDYLPDTMDAPLGQWDGSIEPITSRAQKMTSLLDNILHRPKAPDHWGINE